MRGDTATRWMLLVACVSVTVVSPVLGSLLGFRQLWQQFAVYVGVGLFTGLSLRYGVRWWRCRHLPPEIGA